MKGIHSLFLYAALVVIVCVSCTYGQSTTTTTVSPAQEKSKEEECAALNESCDVCVKNAACLWCPTRPDACSPYPVGQLIPHKDYCDLSDARWGVCWLNYKALLITMGVIAGALVLSISCCCVYCCCCRNKEKARRKYMEEEAKYERESEERKAKHAERKEERQGKYDDIRKKYGIGPGGLVKEDNPYQRFDNE